MDRKSLKTLEFEKILVLLEEYAITYLGKEKCEKLQPTDNIIMIKKKQKETTEATSLLFRFGNPPISKITKLEGIISKIKLGATLSIKELLNIADTLKILREVKSYYKSQEIDNIVILKEYFESLYNNLNVEKEIYRCIKNDEELDDRASGELYNIRRHILDLENRVKDKLNEMVRSAETSKYLQDQVVTLRNDRYVIPVKQEYKNEIKGLVHDASSSGSTIFIEPTAVFNMNNEIKELRIKEQKEIERILSVLTQMIDPISDEIGNSLESLGNIDFAFAKGKLSLEMNAFEPTINQKFYINLKGARHPLIEKEKVVPIDVWIGDKFKTLVVTGPNTGGKTVTLKTIGLLSTMAQSGLHIPAKESSEIAVFKNIYADIGDEQSIEQSLSTFSSHMKNIVAITSKVTSEDLVLLDELGSGTDPVEGAAIAMSVLESLKEIECITLATTHYSELKSYAIETDNVENASCEFNIETLSPTYKLLIGVPGRSNAFAISKKLGLSEKILERANSFLSAETIKFEQILNEMELNKERAKEEKLKADILLREAKIEKEKIETEIKKLENKKEEILLKAKKEARDLLLGTEEEASKIIKDLINLKKDKEKNINKIAEEARTKIKKNISEIQKDLSKPKTEVKNQIKKEEILLGMKVYLPSLDQEVTIISLPDKKDNVMVQSGIVKLNTHISQIEKITKKEETKEKSGSNRYIRSKAKDISPEINLIGKTVDESTKEIEKYLDDAYLAGMKTVRIVHGKGSGALRRGVQEYLKENEHVDSYRLGIYGEGDTGVTVVELK